MEKQDIDILVRIQTLRSALGFYADKGNYLKPADGLQCPVLEDGGKLARDLVKDLRKLEAGYPPER